MRRERIYQGKLIGPAAAEVYGEAWTNGEVAIIFTYPWRQQLAVMRAPSVSLTEDNRLRISGTDDDTGESTEWTAAEPERVTVSYTNVKVTLEDGTVVPGATVRVTPYRVSVLKQGQPTREYVAASVEGGRAGRRTITTFEGAELAVEAKKGCGCGR